MNDGISGTDVFRELEMRNPVIAEAFRVFRQHGEQPTRQSPGETILTWASTTHDLRVGPQLRRTIFFSVSLLAGIVGVAIAFSSTLMRFLALHWQAIFLPAGGAFLGAGFVLLVSRVGTSPLHTIAPPKVDTENPLQELNELADRTASRLRAAYLLQLWVILVVGAMFISLIIWSMVMVSQERILYASAFGSGSIAMIILTTWKWQPFDRINQARRLADNADTLATGLRLRMKTISEISDPIIRYKAQWVAVKEYLERS